MQPPPRKVKPSVALKNIHADQVSKLQAKHQHECDLLEDMRTFFLRKSALEKEYAQGLQKVTSQLLKRDFPAQPDLASEDGMEHNLGEGRTVCTVWRSFLEEAERLAKVRLQAAEVYSDKAAEPLKPARIGKVQCMKKVAPQLNQIQTEVSQCVMDMVKSNKIYATEGGVAHEARQKSSEAEDKLKRKSTGIFQSLASLQKSCAKLRSRTDASEIKETAARNEYLLNLAAANANHIRYYGTDLPEIMKTMDCDIYEKIQESLTVAGQTAAEIAEAECSSFNSIATEAAKICRQFSLQCYLFQNPVFTNLVQYQFEPCHEDSCNKVSGEHGACPELEKEARKWSTKSAKETRSIRDYYRQLTILQSLKSGEKNSESGSQESTTPDPEVKIEELRQNIRKAETAKLKADARLEALRTGGVNVDDWVNQAQMESLAAEESGLARTPSQLSLRTESSGGQSLDDHEPTYTHYDDDDDFIDDTFNTTGISQRTGTAYPIFSKALYDFEASNYDEMSIKAGEELELICDGDGEGWVKAKNSLGQEGYIPETYVDQGSLGDAGDADTPVAVETMNAINNNITEAAVPPAANPTSPTDLQSPTSVDFQQDTTSSYSSGDLEVQQTTEVMQPEDQDSSSLHHAPVIITPSETIWARALYDYEGQTEEELTFLEGAIIKIIRKDDNGVDDGFWEGECNGSTGVFPSLVVEEIGSSATPVDPTSPGAGSNFSIPPPVHVTLPTPDGEPPPPPPMSNGDAASLNSDLDEPLPPPPLIFEEGELYSAEDSQGPVPPPPPVSTLDQNQPKRVRFNTDSHNHTAKRDVDNLNVARSQGNERNVDSAKLHQTPSSPQIYRQPPPYQQQYQQQKSHFQQQQYRQQVKAEQQGARVEEEGRGAPSHLPRSAQRPPLSPLSRHKSLPNCNNNAASQNQKESSTIDRSRSALLPTTANGYYNDNTIAATSSSHIRSHSYNQPSQSHGQGQVFQPQSHHSHPSLSHHQKQSSLPSSPQNSLVNREEYLQFLDVSLASKHSQSDEAVGPNPAATATTTRTSAINRDFALPARLYHSSSQGSMLDQLYDTGDLPQKQPRIQQQQQPTRFGSNNISQTPRVVSSSYDQLSSGLDFDPLRNTSDRLNSSDNPIPKLQPPISPSRRNGHQQTVVPQNTHINNNDDNHKNIMALPLPLPTQPQQQYSQQHYRQALQHHQRMQQQQLQRHEPPISPSRTLNDCLKGAMYRGDKIPLCFDRRPDWDSDEEGEESLV